MTVPLHVLGSAVRGADNVDVRSDRVEISRLPAWTHREFGRNPGISWAQNELSGVRLELTTAATELDLRFRLSRTRLTWVPLPLAPAVLAVTADEFEHVYVFDEGDLVDADISFSQTVNPGRDSRLRVALPQTATPRTVTIWLPHTAGLTLLSLEADAQVIPTEPTGPKWVHYGSSISHCREADSPLGVWPVIAARHLGWNVTNLGLAGNAQLDGFAARTIRDNAADLITVKVGINIVNAGSMRERTFTPAVHAFLDTIREGQPTTPIVLISPICCPAHEHTPGPSEWGQTGRVVGTSISRTPLDGQLTLSDIRATLSEIVDTRRGSDPDLAYLDGRALFGESDVHLLPDGLHPNAEGYQLIATRFIDYINTTTRKSET